MLFKDLLKINEAALVADAVNFDMLSNSEKNLLLCQGFIFNYDPKLPKSSTVAILNLIRESYHSPNHPNVHLLVQDYGKGKSHFGLVVANFFKNTFATPEVQGILNQVEIATKTNGREIFESLTGYKQRSKKHLVLCLSGEKGDLKKLFLKVLNRALELEGITNALAQHICSKPRQYLESLNSQQLEFAERFLNTLDNFPGDVKALIGLLKEYDYQVIPRVIEISRELTGGFPINFEADLNIEEILEDIIKKYCSGSDRQFEGILILLDELNAYLQNWAHNPAAAGGMILHNLTNVCENNKGKIALMCFTQIKPSNTQAMPSGSKDFKTYQKLTSRLELHPSTYEPISSLESVLSNLITPKEEKIFWEELQKFARYMREESKTAYEQNIPIYRERNWDFENFHEYLGKKCFPLHPLTAYLLCNLDFTQGRTAIQFIKEEVKNFIENNEVEVAGRINYIYAVSLVDAFENNFSNYPNYKDYQKAEKQIAATATREELTVLKGLFLFYASGSKLSKPEQQSHAELLSIMTGLHSIKVKSSLDSLAKDHRVIYQLPNQIYNFYSGTGLVDLEQEIDQEVRQDELTGKQYTVNEVVVYCNTCIKQYLNKPNIIATDFVDSHKLRQEEWQFVCRIYTIPQLYALINSSNLPKNVETKGIVAYIIAERADELKGLQHEINDLLENSALRYQLLIAIPQISITSNNLSNILQKLDKSQERNGSQQQRADALTQLQESYKEQIRKGFKEILQNCSYYCLGIEHIPHFYRNSPEKIISELLKQLYPLVPPIDGSDKMALNSTSGSTIIGFAAKHILGDSLTPQILPNASYTNVIDPIFVNQWGLLKKTSQKYSLSIPTNNNIKAAWAKISEITELQGQLQKTVPITQIWEILSQPPYGYNEFTFTILLASWLAYHRSEVFLSGSFGINPKKKDVIYKETKPIKDWVSTNILEKPKEFVSTWISQTQGCLIRRLPPRPPEVPDMVDYDQAVDYLGQIDEFLKSDNQDVTQHKEIEAKRHQLTEQIEKLHKWFQPVEEAEKLSTNATLEVLLNLNNSLAKTEPKQETRVGLLSVTPSQSMRDRLSFAVQSLQAKVDQCVNQYKANAKSLTTAENCGAYKLEIEHTIEQVKKIPSTPDSIIRDLESYKDEVSDQQQILAEQQKINQCLAQITSLSCGLGINATQEDYFRVFSEIEKLVQEASKVKEHESYQKIIQELKQKQEELNSLIGQWEQNFNEDLTLAKANNLLLQIINQKNRFTEAKSQQSINNLLSQLEAKINFLTIEDTNKQQDIQIFEKIRQHSQIDEIPISKGLEKIQIIEQLTKELNYPEKYDNQIQKLLQNIQNKIQADREKLNKLGEEIRLIETSNQLKTWLKEYTKLETIFANCPDFGDYQKLQQPLEETERKISNLEQQHAATAWLDNLREKKKTLITLSQSSDQLKLANTIIGQLQTQQSIHMQFLNELERLELESLEAFCQQIQAQDKENQIISLFEQLSREQKINLHEKLSQLI